MVQRWRPVRDHRNVANPAAGADWSLRNDRGGGLLIYSVVATLTASAAVANRDVSLTASDGTDVWFATGAQAFQTANQTARWSAYAGSSSNPGVLSARPLGWPTDGLWLPPGHTLAAVTGAIDAADQWSAIVVSYVEYPETLPMFLVPSPYLYEDNPQE